MAAHRFVDREIAAGRGREREQERECAKEDRRQTVGDYSGLKRSAAGA
jgi:hypothetical protein